MAKRLGPRAPGGGAGGRRSGWVERAGRWLALGVAAACLAAAVADSDPVGSFAAGVDVAGGGGGGSGGYLAPVSAKLAGPGVITAGNHVQSDGSCTYGRWSDGSCRGCPSGQVWRTGRGCVRPGENKMRQTRSPTTMFALTLTLLVCACGAESREPPIQTAEAAEASPVQPVEASEPSTSMIKEPPPSSTSTADITTTTLKRNNIPAVMERPPVSYLKDTIPPCTPIDQDSPNPCEFGGSSPRTRTSGSHSSERLPDVLPTISEMINELPPTMTPHIVVRATGLPDTTRCDGLYPVRIANFLPEDSWLSNLFRYYCFTDFKINEYIIGDGPPKLTIKHATGRVSLLDPDDVETVDEQWVKETFDLPEPERGSRFQGRELVMILGLPENYSVETWSPRGYYYSMWYITRENNELRAISTAMDRWARTPEHRQQMNRPLDELIREIKQAIETRTVQTGGRIGLDPSLPMLITDANNLQDFYQTVGAVYEGEDATVLPPPVPGQEDPEQDPTQTGENQPTSTIPAPGEEETTPPPTDDATTTTTSASQPQTNDTTTTTSPTGATQPETQDTIPTPTATTQPPANDDNTIPAAESEGAVSS